MFLPMHAGSSRLNRSEYFSTLHKSLFISKTGRASSGRFFINTLQNRDTPPCKVTREPKSAAWRWDAAITYCCFVSERIGFGPNLISCLCVLTGPALSKILDMTSRIVTCEYSTRLPNCWRGLPCEKCNGKQESPDQFWEKSETAGVWFSLDTTFYTMNYRWNLTFKWKI